MLKLAAVTSVPAAVAVIAGDVLTTAPSQIAALAAGVAGVIYLWRAIMRPFAQLVRRSLTAYQHLEQISPFVTETKDRLDALESTAAANEDSLEAITRHLKIPRRATDRRARPA
jgi:CBS domain containing-hemolysin-like protein